MHSIDISGSTSTGIVFKKSQGTYFVHAAGREIVCSISNQLRKQLVYPIAAPTSIRPHVVAVKEIEQVDPVAVGDLVRFVHSGNGSGMITEVLPRKTKLGRLDPGFRPLEQVIVANIDQMIIVVAAAQPAPRWHLVDRYLAQAEVEEIPAVICITKQDLARGTELQAEVATYQKVGYPVVLTSATAGQGLDTIKQVLKDHVSVLAGQSGVGKTTLLNAIQPGLGLRVSDISHATGKGKHTTSHLEMFPLESGGHIVDTPGMKYFRLWDVSKMDLASLFPEMRPYLGRCQFRADCTHSHEPGCEVKQALSEGKISARRYESYLKLRK